MAQAPPPTAQRARLTWADPAKGLAISMVVAFHVTLYLAPAGVDVLLGRGKVLLELFPMPAFFLIAGMAASSHPGLPFRALWWRRIYPVVYVYLLWSLLRAAFYAVTPGLRGGLGDLPADRWQTIALLPVWPSSSYWFLYALALFTAVRWAVSRLPGWVQLVGSALLSVAFTSGLVSVDNVGWSRIGGLFVFFVAGALMGSRVKSAVDASRKWHLVPLAVVLLGSVGLLLAGFRWIPGVALVGQCAAVACGVVFCAHLAAGRARSALSVLGQQSFRIYLFHIFPIVLAAALIEAVDGDLPRVVDVGLQVGVMVGVLFLSLRFAQLRTWRWLYTPPQALQARQPAGGAQTRRAPAEPPARSSKAASQTSSKRG